MPLDPPRRSRSRRWSDDQLVDAVRARISLRAVLQPLVCTQPARVSSSDQKNTLDGQGAPLVSFANS
jgi:hypothetical protein